MLLQMGIIGGQLTQKKSNDCMLQQWGKIPSCNTLPKNMSSERKNQKKSTSE